MAFDIKKYCYATNPIEIKNQDIIEYKNNGINVFYLENGECEFTIHNNTVKAKSGEIFYCNSQVTISSKNNAHIYGVNLTGIVAEKYSKEIEDSNLTDGIFMPNLTQILIQVINNYHSVSENYISSVAFDVISILSQTENKSVISNHMVSQAIILIKNNYQNVYGIEEMARDLDISKSHLVREFLKHTGTTPGKYLNNVRIEAVKQLLVQTTLPLHTIAIKTGFSGDNYLCKSFKKLTGETPMAYKNRIITAQYLSNQTSLLD